MAENQDGMEKSERPSSKRLEQAREKGHVPSSKEFPPVVMFFGAMALFAIWAPTAWQQLHAQSRSWFESAGVRVMTPESAYGILMEVVQHGFLPLFPFLVVMALLGIGSVIVQTGPLWVSDGLQMKVSKLNPINGLKRMISLRSWVELLKSLLKLTLLSIVSYLVVADRMLHLLNMPALGIAGGVQIVEHLAFQLVLWIGLTLVVLAAADFGYQKWQFLRDQRMTKQEVKDEAKDTEGNPLVRFRRQSLQRDRARQRMMQDVPKADVIITNPTHLAVALKYDPEQGAAPKVLAKGAGFLAERIRDIARHAGVPIVENKSLARSLFKLVAVGKEIPSDLYRAVAEVLAYVYRMKQERDGTGG